MNRTEHIADLLPALVAPAPVDLEKRGAAYRQEALRRDRLAYFETRCPVEYRDFDPDHPAIQANRAEIDRVLSWQFGRVGILASGRTNLGKTRAMFALCRRLLCDELVDVGIWHAQDFFSELQQQVRWGRDEAADFVKRQAARPVLFIDDFGQEALAANRQEWAHGWFFRLLDLRIGSGLPLLLTTNFSARDFCESSGEIRSNPFVRRLLDVAEPVLFR